MRHNAKKVAVVTICIWGVRIQTAHSMQLQTGGKTATSTGNTVSRS